MVEDAAGAAEYDPARPGSVGPLTDLHQAVVTEAVIYKDGRLAVRFADRRVLSVPAGEGFYEPFR